MHTDLSVSMDDRPGALAELCLALQRAGVTVGAICGDITGGAEIDHFLVDDPATARRIIRQQGSEVRAEREVLVVDLEDRPDAFGEVTRAVAEAGVNIDLIYLASGNRLVMGGRGVDETTKQMLGELAQGARGPSDAEWSRLTKTELKVVHLVARGLSNSRIAEELFVSTRTVRSHLEHAFKKLSVRSRVELAVKVARRNIGRMADGEAEGPR